MPNSSHSDKEILWDESTRKNSQEKDRCATKFENLSQDEKFNLVFYNIMQLLQDFSNNFSEIKSKFNFFKKETQIEIISTFENFVNYYSFYSNDSVFYLATTKFISNI